MTCLGASCLTHDRFNQLESSTFKARPLPCNLVLLSLSQLPLPLERCSSVLSAAEACRATSHTRTSQEPELIAPCMCMTLGVGADDCEHWARAAR